ncbi:histone-lysine N-methyltransferase SETMAR [Nephila pilipes]|uniref:Histone-lysine N-methyltransferase SETMAR n=1 Tax=Nephila pilipes TaxID=299642 RepID=A0A8X6M7U8_NEPPI|nr:histone-lysine N-methyltransferase SETMAR [Nephila pilipes]
MEISDIRVMMKYEFHRGAPTRQAVAYINHVFGIQVATNATVVRWFKKFRSGDFDLSNQPSDKVENDILKPTEEANSSQSARELSLMYNVSKQTILTHLAKIGKVKKLDKWIPHEFTDAQKERRHFLFFLTTAQNHFSIKSLRAMNKESCTIIASVHRNDLTKMNHQNTVRNETSTRRS